MSGSTQVQLPRQGWVSVIRRTVIVTVICVLASVVATVVILDTLGNGVSLPGYVAAVAMPILLGTPIMFYLMLNQQRLKYANLQLHLLASTDWLTSCLNRRAFTSQVSAHLKPPSVKFDAITGALLIIDADHFKFINDCFGHEKGDEALQSIAGAIRASVRAVDVIGRLGGEEFGVFLHGADPHVAEIVAERIRHAVATLVFAPAGTPHQLTVSVGGVMFEGEVGFSDLFRLADERLYRVKQTGRNRVDLGRTSGRVASHAA